MKMDKNRLGQTDIYVTPVGMGTLTMGFSQKNLSVEEGSHLIAYASQCGINFFDTAQYYDTYRFIRPALELIERPVICSKTLAKDYGDAYKAVVDCLKELRLDSIDIFLMHEVRGISDLECRSGVLRALSDAKKQKLVKAVGLSTHHVDVCAAAARMDDIDVVFALINKDGLGIRKGEELGTAEEMAEGLKSCRAAGKGTMAMKAFGGGNMISEYRKCLDYVTGLGTIDSVMIGMSNKKDVDAAVAYFDGSLDTSYIPDTSGKRLYVDQSDCEGCGACISRCANRAISYGEHGLARINPALCVRCGYCAPVCPVRAIIFL